MTTSRETGNSFEPHEDYGFFGPGSVSWKVWTYPSSLTVGLQRSVVIEELDPALVAAVSATNDIYTRPRTRYDRTVRYFATIAVGDSHAASKAADILVKVHAKAVGTDTVTGKRYDANDPDSQLWILLTGWHSVLKAYEMYGPGKLSPEEESRYWAECAVAAELQTCDPADVPRSRDELRAYYAKMRPQLLGSPLAQKAMAHLLEGSAVFPPQPRVLQPLARLVSGILRAATIATMPRWMRAMAGIRQSRLVDLAVIPLMRIAFVLAHLNKRVELRMLAILSPSTVPVIAPIFLEIPPRRREVVSPSEARRRYGFEKPADAHRAFREKQHARVFSEGLPPSDEGLIESQVVLGKLG